SSVPASLAAPTVSGSSALESPLSADVGAWSSTVPLSFSLQWQACDASGASCKDIPGATGTTYAPNWYYVKPGQTVRLQTTAIGVFGSSTAASAVSAPV